MRLQQMTGITALSLQCGVPYSYSRAVCETIGSFVYYTLPPSWVMVDLGF